LKKLDEAPQIEATEAPVEASFRVEELGRNAGMLPEFVAGPSKRSPVAVNPNFWKYRAALVRAGWTEHSMVTQSQFDNLITVVTDGLHVR
jgi:hypothetical protein